MILLLMTHPKLMTWSKPWLTFRITIPIQKTRSDSPTTSRMQLTASVSKHSKKRNILNVRLGNAKLFKMTSQNNKVKSTMGNNKAMECSNTRMAMFTLGSGLMVTKMEMEKWFTKMALNKPGNSKMAWNMGMATWCGWIPDILKKDSGKETGNKDTVKKSSQIMTFRKAPT